MARRSHEFVELRNFTCAHIKRDDPVSRRFIQYLSNETWDLRALVRDRKTGRILIQPPKESYGCFVRRADGEELLATSSMSWLRLDLSFSNKW
jgi:hypothetical protein